MAEEVVVEEAEADGEDGAEEEDAPDEEDARNACHCAA
jgi:hypothetical protein